MKRNQAVPLAIITLAVGRAGDGTAPMPDPPRGTPVVYPTVGPPDQPGRAGSGPVTGIAT